MAESRLFSRGREYVGKKVDGHLRWCAGCGETVYREKAIERGRGVVVEGTEKRPVEKVPLCPDCEKTAEMTWRHNRRYMLGLAVLAKAEAEGAPRAVLDDIVQRWSLDTAPPVSAPGVDADGLAGPKLWLPG